MNILWLPCLGTEASLCLSRVQARYWQRGIRCEQHGRSKRPPHTLVVAQGVTCSLDMPAGASSPFWCTCTHNLQLHITLSSLRRAVSCCSIARGNVGQHTIACIICDICHVCHPFSSDSAVQENGRMPQDEYSYSGCHSVPRELSFQCVPYCLLSASHALQVISLNQQVGWHSSRHG